MDILSSLFESVRSLVPTAVALVCIILVLYLVQYFLLKRQSGLKEHQFKRQLIMVIVSLVGILIIILVLPISDSLRGQLLSLFGILLTAVIALSSTTFVGNAMAGLMLRAVRSFRGGDFISCGEHFGRVSDRGLFHVEIQTEHRDLTTIPNLYLVTNPVKVIRSSGTVVWAEVSLGYDVGRKTVEEHLLEAAKEAGLEDPFTHVMELGDFSVVYRVGGLLTEVKQLISSRSRLREMMLDKLHKGGVEIVSPTFMNTRAFAETREFIPESTVRLGETEKPDARPSIEKVVFDKAEQAESLEKLRQMYNDLGAEIDNLKDQMQKTEANTVKDSLQSQIQYLTTRREGLAELIRRREEAEKEE